jgi:hypothetical protein
MNDDYLWDQTGDPDPEIQQLEQVLGTLRYQPRPLDLPAQVRIGRPRTFFPRVAIAAAIAMMLAGSAAWLLVSKNGAPVGLESLAKPPAPQTPALQTVEKLTPERVATSAKDDLVATSPNNSALENKPKRLEVHKNVRPHKQFRTPRATELTASQRAEGEAAKDQLLLALRVASEKLSLAQKKAQGGYPGNLIRNQHKVG